VTRLRTPDERPRQRKRREHYAAHRQARERHARELATFIDALREWLDLSPLNTAAQQWGVRRKRAAARG
jgi:hypothetical protein